MPVPPLSRQGAALAHHDSLPPNDLVLWTDCSVPFPFDEGDSGVPANCFLALKPLFPFQQAQYVQVYSLKTAPLCTLFAGLGSTNNSNTSLLLFESRSVLFSIFPFSAISLADLAGTVFSLLLYYQATMGPLILVSPRENDAADELARRRALLVPSVVPCSLSPLISRIHPCLFSDWRRTVFSKFFKTQVSSFSTEELMLPGHACCVLSRLRSNGHSLLLSSYLTGIGRIENPSCSTCGHRPRTPLISFCIVQLRNLCVTHFLATLCLYTISVSGPG